MGGINDIIGTACLLLIFLALGVYYRASYVLVNVCLQMACTVSPAFTSMIFDEGVVGFGPPLQATYCVVTSVIGWFLVSLSAIT